MPEQFVVPQFLDVESKIIGPVTGRQLGILMTVMLLEFIIYRLFLNLLVVLGLGLPILFAGLILAFASVNGQPIHFLLLNMVQTLRKPSLRVWDKSMTDKAIKAKVKKEKEEPAPPMPRKKDMSQSHLSELSLVVNTGGVYQPEVDPYGKKE